jgi:protein O-GlcNAc transferase
MVLRGIVERLDRNRFEAIGYSLQRCDDTSFSQRFRPVFDTFKDLPLFEPDRAAEIVAADRLDILIDTTGHTGISCLPLLAQRPAPVQAHYLGYGLTSGADYVDYLVTDPQFMPPEWAQYCSERLVYMPDSFMATTRAPFAPAATSRAAEGLPEDALVLANFNHPCKLEPRMFSLWMRLLQAAPDAVLWLGGWAVATRESLTRFAAAQGVDPRRLIFARILPHAFHLNRLKLADLALDNLYHGGGVTTVDALWAGLPLLAVKGATPAGRLGASLSHAAGLDDLVTDSLEQYEATGLALLQDRERLRALKARLVANLPHCALFDGERYQRHFEAALDLMWAHRGEPRTAPPLRVG